MKWLSLLCAILFFLSSCNNSETKKEAVNKLVLPESMIGLLTGTWINKEDSIITTEVWAKENDTLLIGGASVVKGTDTLFSERIKIINSSTQIVYVPQVSDQNDGKEIVFDLTYCDSTSFRYSNEKHDFPQHIEYKFLSRDSLVARIYSTVEGKLKEEVFPYRRK